LSHLQRYVLICAEYFYSALGSSMFVRFKVIRLACLSCQAPCTLQIHGRPPPRCAAAPRAAHQRQRRRPQPRSQPPRLQLHLTQLLPLTYLPRLTRRRVVRHPSRTALSRCCLKHSLVDLKKSALQRGKAATSLLLSTCPRALDAMLSRLRAAPDMRRVRGGPHQRQSQQAGP
jgi:hypothetical protein